MNAVDVLLVVLLGASAWRGSRVGFLRGVLDLAILAGSVALALRYYEGAALWLAGRVNWADVWLHPAAFLLVAAASRLLLGLIGAALLSRVGRQGQTGYGNRILGVVPGLVDGLILAAIVAALLLRVPFFPTLVASAEESMLARRLAAAVDRAELKLQPVFGEALPQTLNLLTVEPTSSERIALPFTLRNAVPVPEAEAEMLDLVNAARTEAGLAPLVMDPALLAVARQHSADMLAREYFSHLSREGRTPFDRIADAGIPFTAAGENLAFASTIEIAFNGLMNSPGHRANILNPDFGRVGIGVLDAQLHGLMVTQNFRD